MTVSKPSRKVDKGIDRATVLLTEKEHAIYLFLANGYAQVRISDKLGISRQAVNKVAQKLLKLGLIRPIDPKGNPRFYKPTYVSSVVSTSTKVRPPVVSTPKRTLSAKPVVVKDKTSGKIKHWRKRKLDLQHRDYDTVVSTAGERVRLCRVHGIAYTCTILHGPAKTVPWTPVKGGMRGMEQSDLKREVPGIGMVTFRWQKTRNTDELIIWLPEKYFFEWELDDGKRLLEDAVWKARKWFQNRYKAYLGLAIQYRRPEYAFEIFEPAMKRFVHERGTVRVRTDDGVAMADESKKPFPEVEFPTIRQARAFVEAPDRLIRVETALSQLIDTVKTMAEAQREFTGQVQEIVGLKKEIDRLKERESKDKMYG